MSVKFLTVKFVIDACIAIKWFVQEDGHEHALAILRSHNTYLAPDLILPEVAGAFDKKVKSGLVSRDQGLEAIQTLQTRLPMLPTSQFIESAFNLASDLSHPVADCVYLACALAQHAIVVTADTTFIDKAARAGYDDRVILLSRMEEKNFIIKEHNLSTQKN